jgi:Ca2+-binding RTX toxin-like protein
VVGQVAVGGSATGALQAAGDRDWFAVQFQAGVSYTVSLTGHQGGGGTLADPELRLHDAGGAVVATNDDIVDGTNPDSQVVFVAPASGTYYVEAGASLDGYAGSYAVSVSAPTAAGGPGQVLVGTAGNDTVMGGTGDDTVSGAPGTGSSYLRGGAGDDVINGGAGFNDMNGNMGADTVHGGSGDNWVVGGQGNDLLFGGGGTNLILGNLGDDTLTAGPGLDVLRGGKGDDSIAGGAGNDYISGDRGADTESGGAGADIFHTSQDAGVDKVLDFNLAEGDRVQLDPGTTFTVNQVGADTVIDTGNGNQMILVGVQMSNLTPGWIFGA